MDIKSNTVGIIGIGMGILVVIGGGLAAYSSLSNQLVSTQTQLQQSQKGQDDLKKQIEEKDKQSETQGKQITDKDKEIESLKTALRGGNNTITQIREEIGRSKEETQILSACLSGVAKVISAKNQANAIYAWGAVEDKCNSADKIIKRIQESQNEQPKSKSNGVGVSNLN